MSTQFRAHLVRNLKFLRLSMSEIVGQSIGLTAAIVLAANGAGYWALVVQQVGQASINFAMVVFTTGWLPRGIHRNAGMRPFVSYGSSVFGAQLLGYVSRNIDSFIIGGRFGPTQLGLYNRAFQLVMLPLIQLQAPATRVALPVLSRLQDVRDRFNSFIGFGQSALITLVGLVFAMLGSQASAVIEIALGRNWLAAVPILQILLVAGFFQAAGYALYWVFLAKGLTRSNLFYALSTRPIMIGLIALGSLWGVLGVASMYAISVVMLWPIGLLWIRRVSDVDTGVLFRNGARALSVFGVAAVVSYASTLGFSGEHPVIRLLVGWPVLIGAWLLGVAVWPKYRADIAALWAGRLYLKRRGKPAPAEQQVDETEVQRMEKEVEKST